MNKGYGKSASVRVVLGVACGAAVLTACGGAAEPPGRTDDRPAAAKPLAQSALHSRAFTPGEKIGPYLAGEYLTSGGPSSEHYGAGPRACTPLVNLGDVGVTPGGAPFSQVHRKVADPVKPRGAEVAVSLRSFPAGGADQVMRKLRTAGERCTGGFKGERGNAAARYTAVEELPAPAGIGDEAQAYRLTLHRTQDPRRTTHEYLTVVRSGVSTLAFRADALEAADPGGVPKEIVDAQWERFQWGRFKWGR